MEGKVILSAEEGIYVIENGNKNLYVSCFEEEVTGDTTANLKTAETAGEIIANSSGNATLTFKLRDDESIIIPSLPEGARYTITESASDHVASFNIRATGDNATITNRSGGNILKEQSLSTANERIDADDGNVTVMFTNTRNIATTTGVIGNIVWWQILLAIITLFGGVFVYMKYRRRAY